MPEPEPSAGRGIAWLALVGGAVFIAGIALVVVLYWQDGGIILASAAFQLIVFGLFLLAVAGAFGLLFLLLGIFDRR